MEQYRDFFKKLNQLTKETGIIIDTYGDEFYNPSLATDQTLGGYNVDDRIYFSYDDVNETYIAKLGNPYDGEVIFPKKKGAAT